MSTGDTIAQSTTVYHHTSPTADVTETADISDEKHPSVESSDVDSSCLNDGSKVNNSSVNQATNNLSTSLCGTNVSVLKKDSCDLNDPEGPATTKISNYKTVVEDVAVQVCNTNIEVCDTEEVISVMGNVLEKVISGEETSHVESGSESEEVQNETSEEVPSGENIATSEKLARNNNNNESDKCEDQIKSKKVGSTETNLRVEEDSDCDISEKTIRDNLDCATGNVSPLSNDNVDSECNRELSNIVSNQDVNSKVTDDNIKYVEKIVNLEINETNCVDKVPEEAVNRDIFRDSLPTDGTHLSNTDSEKRDCDELRTTEQSFDSEEFKPEDDGLDSEAKFQLNNNDVLSSAVRQMSIYHNVEDEEDDSLDIVDANSQFEESLNPSSLPFESLNSSFQYSVLIDSCSEDEDDDNEGDSSFTNPSDNEPGTGGKMRLMYSASAGSDSLDFLSTEAENKLECCDQWSLGSCSLTGYECKNEKRRRSVTTKEGERKPSLSGMSEDGEPNYNNETECNTTAVNNINEAKDRAIILNEVSHEDNFTVDENLVRGTDSLSLIVNGANSAASAVSDATTEVDDPVHFVDQQERATDAVTKACNTPGTVATSHDCIVVSEPNICTPEEQQEQKQQHQPRCSNDSEIRYDEQQHSSQNTDTTSLPPAATLTSESNHDSVVNEPTNTDSGDQEDSHDKSVDVISTVGNDASKNIETEVSTDSTGDETADKHVDSNRSTAHTRIVLLPNTNNKCTVNYTSLHCPTIGSALDPFRRCSSLHPCTVILPPCIDEEPDVLEEGADLSAIKNDSRSSHSSGQSGHTVGGDDNDSIDDRSNANDRIYESVNQSVYLNNKNLEESDTTESSDILANNNNASNTKNTTSESSNKPELRSYFGKSMLPGLSGLHGLSSLRQSGINANISSQNKVTPENQASENDTKCTAENDGAHNTSRASYCSGNGSTTEEIAWVSRRLQAHRQLSSSDSWGSEEFESYSSNEEELAKEDLLCKSSEVSMNSSKISQDSKISADSVSTVTSTGSGVAPSAGREKLKARLLRKREQWRERRQSSSKEFKLQHRKDSKDSVDSSCSVAAATIKEGKEDGSLEDVAQSGGGSESGKLSRWFSLRKSVNYDLDRKGATLAPPTGGPLSSTHPPLTKTTTGSVPTKTTSNVEENNSELQSTNIPTTTNHDIFSQTSLSPNSFTLSSISSMSSNSSTSTNSSNSSLGVGSLHHNPYHHSSLNSNTTNNSNINNNSNTSSNLRLPQLLEMEERMIELEASTNPTNYCHNLCGGLGSLGAQTFQRKHQPPSLPPIPPGLTTAQIKRRHIVASIVHSENNYVATLHRLIREYRKPLEDSKPPIISQSKISILFHFVYEILQCHTMFRIALTESVRHWDRDEKIGEVFLATFSKAIILDIYSEFINNFTRGMELAKLEGRKKSVFADFLKMRQITSPDRLSFFGMMVKPVQRFPQFILFLQDLLKHTPKGHADRMSLQLALTQLESLAENLNEQKRESEQHQAFKAALKQINSKFALRNISEGNRCLIRQDDVTKLEFGPNGLIKQTKERRLFLTTDTVICVSVVPKSSDDIHSQNERLSLKWVYPITEIEVQENNSSLTLSRLLAAGLSQRPTSHANSALGKQGNVARNSASGTMGNTTSDVRSRSVYDIYSNKTAGSTYGGRGSSRLEESEAMVGAICAEMNDLMHDYTVVSRIAELVGTLKGSYDHVNSGSLQQVMSVIQENIQARDDRMSWLDGCCLQVKAGKDKEVMTFHVQDPNIKKDWIIELRLAQLAASSVNSLAWQSGGDRSSQRPPSRRPLFVTALPLLHAAQHTQVVCGCQYPVLELPKNVALRSSVMGSGASRRGGKTHTSVWLCSTDGVTSHVTRYVTHLGGLKECIRVTLREVCVTAMLHVPPHTPPPQSTSGTVAPNSPPELLKCPDKSPLAQDTVWIGTLQNRLMVYSAGCHDDQQELYNGVLPAAVASLIYHCQQVFIGLTNGELLVYNRTADDGCWQLTDPVSIKLSDCAPVTALLPLSAQLYAAVGDTVLVLECRTLQLAKQLSVHHGSRVALLAHSGVGLWLCEEGSSTVCLYHTESCLHLQDIDLAPSVTRMLGGTVASCTVTVTALVVSRGLLWVGTSVGVTLTLPLPRLQGVPIISGRPTLSYHAHTGPVTFLMTLMPREYYVLPPLPPAVATAKTIDASDLVAGQPHQQGTENKSGDSGDKPVTKENGGDSFINDSSVCNRKLSTEGNARRDNLSKACTLPRGFGGGGVMGREILSAEMESSLGEISGNLVGVTVGGSDDGEVMGLCGELLRHCWGDEGAVTGAEGDGSDSLRRSDPSLSCLSSTLDRRLRLRAGRPRSLDLSSASIDSKVSAATTTSSGSEDGHGGQSRQNSILDHFRTNDTIPESDQSRKNSAQETAEEILLAEECKAKTEDATESSAAEDGVDSKCKLESESIPDIQLDTVIDEQVEVSKENYSDKNNPSVNEGNLEEKPMVDELRITTEESVNTDQTLDASSENPKTETASKASQNFLTVGDISLVTARKLSKPIEDGNILDSKSETSLVDPEIPGSPFGKRNEKRGVHRRSNSDVTYKSRCSSTSNISSLYYDGDGDIFNSTKRSLASTADTIRIEDKDCDSKDNRLQLDDSVVSSNKVALSSKASGTLARKSSATNTLSRNIGTLSRSPTGKSTNGKSGGSNPSAKGKEAEQPRTILVLTGGQGYKCIRENTPTNGPPNNNTDAHILVWEMKL